MGTYPEFELGVQIVEEEDEFAFDFDLLDPTKIIPEELVPVRRIGKMDPQPQPGQLLRRNRAGCLPSGARRPGDRLHQRPAPAGAAVLLPGYPADPSGRPELPRNPINRPSPVHNNQRDGFHRQTINKGVPTTSPTRWPRAAR
jgi:catalase